jgi:hypothetical protein
MPQEIWNLRLFYILNQKSVFKNNETTEVDPIKQKKSSVALLFWFLIPRIKFQRY